MGDEILDWEKKKTGLYKSTNNRFIIEKITSQNDGEYWSLKDNKTCNTHYLKTLNDSKARAECIQIGVF